MSDLKNTITMHKSRKSIDQQQKAEEIKPEIKGFELSTDYKKLWNIIHQGFRVPAWIEFERHNLLYKDLVEVKFHIKYSIGTRGIGYESYKNNFKDFNEVCKSLNLRFIEPKIN